MESGKVEFAPDYKSRAEKTADRYRSFFEATKMNVVDLPSPNNQSTDAERSRLERKVIETAKAYGRANQAIEDHMKKAKEEGDDPADGWQQLRDLESTWEEMLLEAIKPLLEFESKQNQK